MAQNVYFFGKGRAEGTRDWKHILGGKGANLAEMVNLGIPVPPGFTISTAMCDAYLRDGKVPEGLKDEVDKAIAKLEKVSGRKFGDPERPLLVSVRSGGKVSMPGMMETILNLGLNDKTVEALARESGNPRFAWDSYRRFLQMYGDVVLNVPNHHFEALLASKRMVSAATTDAEVPVELLQALVVEYKALSRSTIKHELPMDPREQLWGAIEAVWHSWMIKRAVDYRKQYNIDDTPGTAVNIVSMVFGNLGDDSGTGVAFTRDPATGAKRFYGEFLVNAQGEDVVAGTRTPLPIDQMATMLPGPYTELLKVQETLEKHFRDMQDLEFTVEKGTLYLLQTRTGKRTVGAAVRIARDMVNEGLITRHEAVSRVQPQQLDQLLHPVIDTSRGQKAIATGLPASPGAASGIAVFDADAAEVQAHKGQKVILVREETTPDDFHGIVAARAVLTARGGMTSHAAVVARGMGKCAVVGCSEIKVDTAKRVFAAGSVEIREGEWITLDGATGRVYKGDIPTKPSEVMRVLLGELPPDKAPVFQAYGELLEWADEARRLKVRANADTPHDARAARRFGAEGIGLCRTEHMFFEGDRITPMREMIVAHDECGRRRALEKLLPMQRTDFEGIFEAMDGLPVTIRLLDPPLHEFLPHGGEEAKLLARTLGISRQELTRIVDALRETNPMLGHRGCRLGITYPEITEMQCRAIFEAAANVTKRGIKVHPEVMVPLVAVHQEFTNQKKIIDRVAAEVAKATGVEVAYLVGTMIELPRAALTAAEIVQAGAQFFSFGTNDLTQTTMGLSRDDAGRFVPFYVEQGLLAADPFQVLDTTGVGKLITIAVADGRGAKPGLKVGICGEHGGEPRSIAYCHAQGLDYVSCSPFRVPIARLAAAHAALDSGADATL